MGGLFGTYTLIHRPAAFRRYILGSPWLCWDAATTTAYEPVYAADHNNLDATVFLAAGADEDVLPPAMPAPSASLSRTADTAGHTRRLAEALEQRRYPSLELTWRIFPEETHFTMVPILIAHGLRAVYADWRQSEARTRTRARDGGQDRSAVGDRDRRGPRPRLDQQHMGSEGRQRPGH